MTRAKFVMPRYCESYIEDTEHNRLIELTKQDCENCPYKKYPDELEKAMKSLKPKE